MIYQFHKYFSLIFFHFPFILFYSFFPIYSFSFLFIHSFVDFHSFFHSFIFINSFSFIHFYSFIFIHFPFSSRTSCWKAHWRLTTCRASWPSSLLPTVPWGNTPGQKTTTSFSITWVQKCYVIVSLMLIKF
jgi:hypothetical protein